MSADGGASWQDRGGVLPAGLRVRRGVFLAAAVGWIATTEGSFNNRLFVTHDGGTTWVAHSVADGLGELASIGFDAIDDRHAVVVAQDARALAVPRSSFGRSWVTIDGGSSWTATEHPPPINFLTDVDLVP